MHRTKKLASFALAMVMVLAFIPVTPGAFAKASPLPKATLTGDIINIPYDEFKEALPDSVKDKKGNVLKSKAKKLTELDISYEDIKNLAGIEYFTALKKLNCRGNQLTALDMSNNTALTWLVCYGNQLTKLDVSGCTALEKLDCSDNKLTKLDVSGCTALKTLECYDNQLTKLDVNTALKELECDSNQLTELDVSGCTALTWLICYNNKLTDISSFAGLNDLWKLDVSYNCIDITPGSPAMKIIKAFPKREVDVTYKPQNAGTQATLTGDIINIPDAKFKYALPDCVKDRKGNVLKSKAKKLTELTEYDVSMQGIKNLAGIEYFTALKKLDCSDNQLTELDLSKNTALTRLDCPYNKLTKLDVSGCTALEKLKCDWNKLTELNVSNSIALKRLDCSYNKLTELNVSNSTALKWLDCYENKLTELDVSKNTALTELVCYENKLTELNVSKNIVLKGLSCGYNKFTELDVSKNTALRWLYCEDNQLTELDVSKNTALRWLDCWSNQLTDISSFAGLNDLEYLDVDYNCIDITPGSPAMKIVQMFLDRDVSVKYEPQNESTPPTTQPTATPSPNTSDSSLVLLAGIVLMLSVGAVTVLNVRKTA